MLNNRIFVRFCCTVQAETVSVFSDKKSLPLNLHEGGGWTTTFLAGFGERDIVVGTSCWSWSLMPVLVLSNWERQFHVNGNRTNACCLRNLLQNDIIYTIYLTKSSDHAYLIIYKYGTARPYTDQWVIMKCGSAGVRVEDELNRERLKVSQIKERPILKLIIPTNTWKFSNYKGRNL
jgi:hypothetical protein